MRKEKVDGAGGYDLMFTEPFATQLELERARVRAWDPTKRLTYDCRHAIVRPLARVACDQGFALSTTAKDETAGMPLVMRGTAIRACSKCPAFTGPSGEIDE